MIHLPIGELFSIPFKITVDIEEIPTVKYNQARRKYRVNNNPTKENVP